MTHSIVHRALVTYSDEATGEIRVRIPAVTGLSEVSISHIGRSKTNNIWVVPTVGSQIVVSADDYLMTNVFWVHTDGYNLTSHYRNYFEAISTSNTSATLTDGVGDVKTVSYDSVVFSEGISLQNGSKVTFKYDGVYNFQYSIQWLNTDSQAHDTVAWFSYNGTPHPNSATYVLVPSKHGTINGSAVTAINFVDSVYANDYVQLQWAGNSTTLSTATVASGTITSLPSVVPVSPAVILTVTQVA